MFVGAKRGARSARRAGAALSSATRHASSWTERVAETGTPYEGQDWKKKRYVDRPEGWNQSKDGSWAPHRFGEVRRVPDGPDGTGWLDELEPHLMSSGDAKKRLGHDDPHRYRPKKFKNQRLDMWQSPDTASGTYAVMRRPSSQEIQAVDGRVDARLLKAQHDELKMVLEAKGIPVWMLPEDEKSPFSSRIGRYMLTLPAMGLMAEHPDGMGEKAHKQLFELLGRHKVKLNLRKIGEDYYVKEGGRERRFVSQFVLDPRDIVKVGLRCVTLVRDGGTTLKAAGTIQEHITDPFKKTYGAAWDSKHQLGTTMHNNMSVRVIDGGQRGLRLPLCKYVGTPDGEVLLVDETSSAVKEAIEQSGLLMTDLEVVPAPAYACEVCPVETRNGEAGVKKKPLCLFPRGFPEASRFLQKRFESKIDLEEVDWTEWLKLGVSIREVFLHIRPLMNPQGQFTGAYAQGHHGKAAFDNDEEEWAGLSPGQWSISGSKHKNGGFNRTSFNGSQYADDDAWSPRMDPKTPAEVSWGGMPGPGAFIRKKLLFETASLDQDSSRWSEMGLHGLKPPDSIRHGTHVPGVFENQETSETWRPGDKPRFQSWHQKASENVNKRWAQVRAGQLSPDHGEGIAHMEGKRPGVPWASSSVL